DDERVVYVADAESDALELYVAPLDGSRNARKLDARLVSGGNVLPAFQLTPRGETLVYAADARADETVGLFQLPLVGARAATRPNAPFVEGGDVLVTSRGPVFAITPDGANVIYIADQDTNGVFELYESALEHPVVRTRSPGSGD